MSTNQQFFKSVFIALLFTATSFCAMGVGNPGHPIILSKATAQSQRPKAPAMQNIQCLYDSGYLTIEFDVSEGLCVLSITDYSTDITKSFSFDSSIHTSIYIGEIESGSISICTSNNITYTGEL